MTARVAGDDAKVETTISWLTGSIELDRDLVAAIAWCRIGGAALGRPVHDSSFRRAEQLGLLAHDPIWRATAAGEGVLVAANLLEGAPAPGQRTVHVLWASCDRYSPPQFVQAWPDGFVDCDPEQHGREVLEAQREYEDGGDGPWTFWLTVVELDEPPVPGAGERSGSPASGETDA